MYIVVRRWKGQERNGQTTLGEVRGRCTWDVYPKGKVARVNWGPGET